MTASALRAATPPFVAAPDAEITLAPERPQDAAAVEALVAAGFGPGRFAKTAERVREAATFRADLSFCAWRGADLAGAELAGAELAGAELAGAVRLWSVAIGGRPAVFLGPIAVAAHLRGRGIAAALTERACDAARAAGERAVVLVGDLARFGPMGFSPAPLGSLVLPGPVDARRILWRGLGAQAVDELQGALTGRGA